MKGSPKMSTPFVPGLSPTLNGSRKSLGPCLDLILKPEDWGRGPEKEWYVQKEKEPVLVKIKLFSFACQRRDWFL